MSRHYQSVNKLNCECAWPGATSVLCKSVESAGFCGFRHPSKGMQYKVYMESGVFLDIIPHDKVHLTKIVNLNSRQF